VTRKLRKLWTKYSEAKGELDGAWGDWAAEKEEMLDSVRMLQQQLTLKDLVIQAFIPPQDVQKVHLTACLLATLLAYWLPCLPTGYPACLLATLLAYRLPCLPTGYPACLLATLLAYWVPCLPAGYPACLLATLLAYRLPCLPAGYPACLLGTLLAYWLPCLPTTNRARFYCMPYYGLRMCKE